MKVVTLLGSPRRKGNCATVLNWAVQELEGMGHDVECHHIAQQDIKGCLGCYTCQRKLDEPGCVQKDDAAWVFERMMAADAIIYASPLFFWSFTGQMKCLLDRHICLVKGYQTKDHKSFLDGKHAALLLTCEGPIEPLTKAPKQIFDRMQKFTKFNVAGKYVIPHCTSPKDLTEDAMDTARNLARTLAGEVMSVGG